MSVSVDFKKVDYFKKITCMPSLSFKMWHTQNRRWEKLLLRPSLESLEAYARADLAFAVNGANVCHGLNCVPARLICWSSNPQHRRIGLSLKMGSLKRQLGYEVESLMENSSCLCFLECHFWLNHWGDRLHAEMPHGQSRRTFLWRVIPTLVLQLSLDSVFPDLHEDFFSDWPGYLTF